MPDGLSDWLGDMKNVIEERDKMPIDSTFQGHLQISVSDMI